MDKLFLSLGLLGVQPTILVLAFQVNKAVKMVNDVAGSEWVDEFKSPQYLKIVHYPSQS